MKIKDCYYLCNFISHTIATKMCLALHLLLSAIRDWTSAVVAMHSDFLSARVMV